MHLGGLCVKEVDFLTVRRENNNGGSTEETVVKQACRGESEKYPHCQSRESYEDDSYFVCSEEQNRIGKGGRKEKKDLFLLIDTGLLKLVSPLIP